jgi:hypothetical protein
MFTETAKKLWEKCALKAVNEESAKAAIMIFDCELPEMTGSEKQVEWAESIFAESKWSLVKSICKGNLNCDAETVKAEIVPVFKTTDAKFWIDNRNRLRF